MTSDACYGPEYYDLEAGVYDESRGGVDRARAAADAVLRLLPAPGTLLDVGGGTGIVSAELAVRGCDVLVADLSPGMLGLTEGRLPGRALVSEAGRLGVRDGAVEAVTMIWLLHLLPADEVSRAVSEAARVLAPGGHLVTTVDKSSAHRHITEPATDARATVTGLAEVVGLRAVAATTFSGRSRWRSVDGGDPVFTLLAFERVSPPA